MSSSSDNSSVLVCERREHPWSTDSAWKGYRKGLFTFVCCWVGALIVWHIVANGLPWSHSPLVAAAGSHSLGLPGASALVLLTAADAVFRCAAVAWETSFAPLQPLLLSPSQWWQVPLALVVCAALIALFARVDRPALRHTVTETATTSAVAPSPSGIKGASGTALRRSVAAWVVLGPGRLLAGPLLVPAAYLLLNPWLCGVATVNPATGVAVSFFVAPDCNPSLPCYQGAHWALLSLSAVALAALLWAHGTIAVPGSASVGFGLAHYAPVTVPARLALAAAAKVIPIASPLAAASAALALNTLLLLSLILFLRCGTVALPPAVTAALTACYAAPVVVGTVAVWLLAVSLGVSAANPTLVALYCVVAGVIGGSAVVWLRRPSEAVAPAPPTVTIERDMKAAEEVCDRVESRTAEFVTDDPVAAVFSVGSRAAATQLGRPAWA